MNVNASEASEHEDEPGQAQQPQENQVGDQLDQSPFDASDSSSADVDSAVRSESPIRVGSPFAVDPLGAQLARPIEAFYDVGPVRYTAMGAVAASLMVLAFASVAAWWFPAGGAMIAALGCLLSVFGMYSSFRITSLGLLAVHLFLFVLSYGRSIS